MGTSNFKVFNETFSNSHTDLQYEDDPQRVSGVVPGVAPSALHNKFYRQVSVMTAALGQVIANRGYNANDTDLAALITALSSAFSPFATSANLTYYVNDATGNDANDGLAAAAGGPGVGPLKTIKAAVNKIPQIVNHTVTINVAAGTNAETISLSGFVGSGSLTINGDTIVSTSRTITNIILSNCTCSIGITGFNLGTASGRAVTVGGCSSVLLSQLNSLGAADFGLYVQQSKVYMGSCTISNKTNAAMYAWILGDIASDTNTGTGNVLGLGASHGGLIAKNGPQPGGTTAESFVNGGVIR